MKIKLLLKGNADFKIVFTAFCFYASACLAYFLAFKDTTVLPVWPATGIGLALIILLGRNAWPGITIGALIANLMAYWNNPALPASSIITISCLVALSNTFEVLIGYTLITKWIKDCFPFGNTRNAFRFLFVAILMSSIGALISTVSLYSNNVISNENFIRTDLSFWSGNIVGVLLFTPLVLAFAQKHHVKISPEKLGEIGIFILCTIGMLFVLRIEEFHFTVERALPFLVLPFLLWVAFRFDLSVAMAGVLAVSLLSIYFTTEGDGPFVLNLSNNSILLLQIFICVLSTSTIVLSATVKERMDAQQKLLGFTETLEVKVKERTKALHEEIEMRKSGEEKLLYTNQELSKRNAELDNFVYSVSHDLRAPIASVLGLINVAKKDHDLSMKDSYLEMIQNSALQQDHFIKDILDQSRNSRLEVRREEILFDSMIDETFTQLKFSTANGQAVSKVINVKQNKPFYSDRWRLKVILNNIISNSIRYRNGRDPHIEVNIEIHDDFAFVEIQDNGKGIAKEHLANVCHMFYRATDDGAGSGLGLYIVKEAIEKLNGTMDIHSEEGNGTVVRLQIPEISN
jgi:signal transduction histidine kinase